MAFMGNPNANLVKVIVSPDKLTAHIALTAKEGVETLDIEVLSALIEQYGVKYGILHDAIARFAANPKQYVNEPLLIAKGVAPEDGKDGYVHFLYNTDSTSGKPQVLEDGRVDFRDVLKINNVKKGQVIAERVPAVEGTPGIAVTGENIPPKKAKEAYLKPGKNVVVDDERTRMYAVIDGLVTFTDHDKVNVFPVYEVQGDVDYRSGNVDFVGNVVVRGNVISGFKVKAEGDIRILGSVEGAEVTASGSIDIAEGIVAHNKGWVKAGKTIKCSFIQDGNVEAGEDLIVSQSIMHSKVRAGRNVICKGSKGLIVGGVVQAGETVSARTVGNMTHTPTTIEVGVKPELRNELSELYKQIKSYNENLDKTEKALKILEPLASSGSLPPDKAKMLEKLRRTKQQLLEQHAIATDRIAELEGALENTELAKVEVDGLIYGGAKIVIGRSTRFLKDTTQQVVFRLEDGEVTMSAKFTS